MQAIRFEKVYFSYGDEENAFALNGVDFSVEEGEFVAVLGHNGSGKSTLARLADGLLSPAEGKITVLGLDASDDKNAFPIRSQVGIVFQNPDNQTVASIVEDDVAFGPENVGIAREEIGRRIDFALEAVGMTEYRHAATTRLSGGQKQRVAIAGVLALKPRVMILDESTAMLDPKGRREVMDVVLRLNREEGITVLLVTHFPEEALLADRAIVMNEGKIVMEGKPAEILTQKEELEKYALTLPVSVGICRALKAGGLDVADALNAEELASSIAAALERRGAGARLTQKEDLNDPTVCEFKNGAGGIVCENLRYTYNANSPFSSHALNGVNLTIGEGEFFGIIGHTGSGKSTFVQHLNALVKLPSAEKRYKPKKPKKGALPPPPTVLKVGKFDLSDRKTDFRALRSRVGMVFQYPEYQLFAETVKEDVAFGLKNFASEPLTDEAVENAVREAIETVGLDYEKIKERSPFELSGGQRRRVAIAGVIVTKPEILVLDEPAAGLDPLGKREIMELLHKIHADWCKTVIVVSHDMNEISENCTRAAVFSEGRAILVAPPKTLFAQPETLYELGLDVPFTAKVTALLKKRGIVAESDLTAKGFVEATLALAGKGGKDDA